jgi:uncharacterized protein (TIGR02996 family)
MMDRETALLQQLAEHPEDRGLRLVFSDWLQEQGDPRGEVIALCARGELSLTEQRKVARLTVQHAASWLGPLAQLADLHRSRFVDGFLHELVCVTRPSKLFAALAGDPRLSTVKRLAVPPSQQPTELEPFLSHPVLRGLERLELGSSDWRQLTELSAPFTPREVVVASWGVFERELAPLHKVSLFQQGTTLGLSTTEFMNGLVVSDVFSSLMDQATALQRFREVQLLSRYGVLEGSASWLLVVDRLGRALPAVDTWGVESGEVAFTRSRPGEEGHFSHLVIDLSLPEGQGEKQLAPAQLKSTIEVRIATAASVLVLLGSAQLTSVEIKLAKGARLRPTERSTLVSAARRSGSLQHFVIQGEAVLP